MRILKFYSPYHFSFFRIIVGVYLTIHFISLIPYGPEVWSNKGILPKASLNLTHGVFPNILNLFDSPLFIQIFLAILVALSILLTIGFKRSIVSILIWYGWVCLFDRNNFINNPGIPFIGWLLLCLTVIPKGEPLSFKTRRDENWKMPAVLFIGAWIIMSLSYTISGIDKFLSPSWRNGQAVQFLLENPLARDGWLRELSMSFPSGVLTMLTWSILTLEIVFLPFAIFKKTRFWIWLGMIFLHLSILLLVDFADLTVGMLMIHWFTFDDRWLKPKPSEGGQSVVFFDGVCGLCNSAVDLFMQEDHHRTLFFAPLQGDLAKKKMPDLNTDQLDTIVFYHDNKVLEKSDAVLAIVSTMGGIFKLAVIFKVVPRSIRDNIYSFVAKNRYKWFGKKEACRMPTPEERSRFL